MPEKGEMSSVNAVDTYHSNREKENKIHIAAANAPRRKKLIRKYPEKFHSGAVVFAAEEKERKGVLTRIPLRVMLEHCGQAV